MRLSKPISLAFAVLVSLASPHVLMSCGVLDGQHGCGVQPTDEELRAAFEALPKEVRFPDSSGTLVVSLDWRLESEQAFGWMTQADASSPCESEASSQASALMTVTWEPWQGDTQVLVQEVLLRGLFREFSGGTWNDHDHRFGGITAEGDGWSVWVSHSEPEPYRLRRLRWERGDLMVLDGEIMGLVSALATAR